MAVLLDNANQMSELNPLASEFKLATTSEVGLPVAVWVAAAYGNKKYVVAWLDGQGKNAQCDARCAEHAGGTLLTAAAVGGQYEIITMLLSRGVSVNLQDSFGISALMFAAFKGHADILLALLDAKADASQRDGMGITALVWAERERHTVTAALLRQHAEQQRAKAEARAGTAKEIRSLQKKLREIDELKALLAGGKTLEANQLKKIDAESALRCALRWRLERTARLDADEAAGSAGAELAAKEGTEWRAADRFERSIIRVGASGYVPGADRGVNLVGPPGTTMTQWEYDRRAREYEQREAAAAEAAEAAAEAVAEAAEGSRSPTPPPPQVAPPVSRYAQLLCSQEPAPDEVVRLTLHRTGLEQAWGVRLAGAQRSRVFALRPGGVAWRQGLRVGDVLRTIDGEHAGGHAAMTGALRQALALTLEVSRCQHRIAAETLQRYQRGFAARRLGRTLRGVAAEAAAGVAEEGGARAATVAGAEAGSAQLAEAA